MIDPVDRAVRAIARRNSYALVWAQHLLAHVIMLGGLGLLSLYQPMSATKFLVLTIVSQALVALDNLVSIRMTLVMWRPVRAWEQGARDEAATVAAWRALATLPLEYLRRVRKYPFLFAYLPFVAFATWELALPWYSFWVLAVAGTVVLAYSLIVRYFTMEIVVRPVLEEVARELPPEFTIDARGLPLRWRLLAVAPVINVITGVVVAGLSAHGHHATLDDLGISWLIAVVVSFTISLELTILVVRTLATSLGDLRRATDRVSAGDYSARVPVVAADETGTLAQSFNTMVEGLDERERLREAFGAYVDPELAERILKEGADLALNELWSLIVPVLLRHGGHANKFIGDGLLGVFGTPDPRPDYAARAVRAALEIVAGVSERYHGRIAVGIGVNSGSVVAGTVGGGGRVEFTVIGDTVNTASRVEAVTRETGDDVLITEATRRLLPEGEFELEPREEVALRGRQAGVRLWAPRTWTAEDGARAADGARGRAGATPVPD
jgi:adenylate cyclase